MAVVPALSAVSMTIRARQTGDMTRVLGEVDRIARRGRNFGFRLISITQRLAKLNKDVLTQLSTLIALGVTSPQDRDAIKAWVDGNADRDKARDVYDSQSAKAGYGHPITACSSG